MMVVDIFHDLHQMCRKRGCSFAALRDPSWNEGDRHFIIRHGKKFESTLEVFDIPAEQNWPAHVLRVVGAFIRKEHAQQDVQRGPEPQVYL